MAVAVLLAAASMPLIGAPAGWKIDSGDVVVVCPVTVGGSFEARTASLTGTLTPDAANPSAVAGSLAVDLATLDTGISLRNTHLRERYLEVGRGDGFDHAVLSEITLNGATVDAAQGRVPFTARLTVHGVTRPVNGTATISRSNGQVQVEAAFPVKLPDFEVAKPRFMGVGVKDEVRVQVKFSAADAPGTEQP
jgi:polyisoprenoid-binding protein YceI